MERKYLYEITFVRAIACLLVVMVHVSVRFYFAYDGQHTTLTNFFNQISRIGTPLFAVLSGFLLYNQALNRGFDTLIFLKSRFVKIISPFLFWSFFYLIYKSLFLNYTFPDFSSKEEVSQFIFMILTGGALHHLYFIALVIQFYIFFLLTRKLYNLNTIVLFTIISFYLNYTFVTNNFSFENEYLQHFVNSRAFLLKWIYYFMLGVLLVKLWPKIQEFLIIKKNNRLMILIGCIIIVLTVFDYHKNQLITNSNENFLYTLSVPIFFMVLISLYYRLIMINKAIIKVFIKIGNMSMGIYLIHPLMIYLYSDFAPFDVTAKPWLILLHFVIVVALCMVVLYLLSFIPLHQYIVTLVNSKNANIDYNLRATKELIWAKNPRDYEKPDNPRLDNVSYE